MRVAAASPISRARVLAAAILVGIATVAGWFVLRNDWSPLQAIGVPTLERPYADARSISGATVALARGLDPLVQNPGDPWGRTLDYPRLWLLPAHLGLGPGQNWVLVLAFFAAAAVGAVALGRLVDDRRTALVLGLGALAPTTWLALERANNDLLLFGLCCVAVACAAQRVRLSGSLLAVAAVLKLYPIAGLCALLRDERERRSRWWIAAVLVGFAVYVALTLADVQHMRAGAARAEWLSYGIDIVPSWLAKNTPVGLGAWITIAAATLALAFALALRRRRTCRLGAGPTTPRLAGFRLGAATYLATFALGSNFDYRLLFLLPALPQLVHWAGRARGPARPAAQEAIVVILLLQWSLTWRTLLQPLTGRTVLLALDDLLTWVAWFALAGLFALTLPDWLLPRRWANVQALDAEREEPPLALPSPRKRTRERDRTAV